MGQTEGLLRISGNATTMLRFYDAVNQGSDIRLDNLDVHTISGLFKLFFRKLPEPIMTFERFDAFLDVLKINTLDKKIEEYKRLLSELPDVHQFTLQHIFSFFGLVASYSDVNKMTSTNIAIVMAPVLLYR